MGVDAQLVPGERGVFDVIVDGRTVFSKYASHRFPEHKEIVAALKT